MNFLLQTTLESLIKGAVFVSYVIAGFYLYKYYLRLQAKKDYMLDLEREKNLINPKELSKQFKSVLDEYVNESSFEDAQVTRDIITELEKGVIPDVMYKEFNVIPNRLMKIDVQDGIPIPKEVVSYTIERINESNREDK
jgi:hypothetical protein